MKFITTKQVSLLLRAHAMKINQVPKTDKKSLVVVSPMFLESMGINSFQITFVSSGIYKYESLASHISERMADENKLPIREMASV